MKTPQRFQKFLYVTKIYILHPLSEHERALVHSPHLNKKNLPSQNVNTKIIDIKDI